MEQLWNKRIKVYHKMLLKYLRYVFNDHFILALLFLAGAISLSYADFLKKLTLSTAPWWSRLVVIIICFVVLHIGKLATLVKPADQVFLLAKEVQMKTYLKKAFLRSVMLNGIFQILVILILVPFLIITLPWTKFDLILFGVLQVSLKVLELFWQNQAYYKVNKTPQLLQFSLEFIVLALSLWGNVLLGIIALCGIAFWQKMNTHFTLLEWSNMIEAENKRMYKLYAFFNLFTDVPFIQTRAKRRKYLDWLLGNKKDVYSYLYWRNFVRNSQYSGLYLRLTCLGGVILAFSQDFRLTLLVAALFIYLIGFQLMPMFFVYDEIVFIHLYPLSKKQKVMAFRCFLQLILYVTTGIYTIISLVTLKNIILSFSVMLVLGCLSWFLANKYLILRIKKVA